MVSVMNLVQIKTNNARTNQSYFDLRGHFSSRDYIQADDKRKCSTGRFLHKRFEELLYLKITTAGE